ncbi:P-type ATPase, subfamily IV, partial [Kipferlia bialata]
VGDIVAVRQDEEVPADLVLLSTTNAGGIAYAQTANLDGETNLKAVCAVETTSHCTTREDISGLRCLIVCNVPNSNLSKFSGRVRVNTSTIPEPQDDGDGMSSTAGTHGMSSMAHRQTSSVYTAGKTPKLSKRNTFDAPEGGHRRMQSMDFGARPFGGMEVSEATDDEPERGKAARRIDLVLHQEHRALSISNVLLRGVKMSNTEVSYGCVVYAGHETKLYMNSKQPSSKHGQVETQLNRLVLGIFVLVIVFDLLYSFLAYAFGSSTVPDLWYLQGDIAESTGLALFISRFLAHMAVLGWAIPMSLFVTLEMVKLIQGRLMEYDENCNEPGKGVQGRLQVKNSSITDELGHIQFVVSDKTGTLTENDMVFDSLYCGGEVTKYTNLDDMFDSETMLISPGGMPLDALDTRRLSSHDHTLTTSHEYEPSGSQGRLASMLEDSNRLPHIKEIHTASVQRTVPPIAPAPTHHAHPLVTSSHGGLTAPPSSSLEGGCPVSASVSPLSLSSDSSSCGTSSEYHVDGHQEDSHPHPHTPSAVSEASLTESDEDKGLAPDALSMCSLSSGDEESDENIKQVDKTPDHDDTHLTETEEESVESVDAANLHDSTGPPSRVLSPSVTSSPDGSPTDLEGSFKNVALSLAVPSPGDIRLKRERSREGPARVALFPTSQSPSPDSILQAPTPLSVAMRSPSTPSEKVRELPPGGLEVDAATMFTCMALCNAAMANSNQDIPATFKEGSLSGALSLTSPLELKYTAQSPDEVALVRGAAAQGVVLAGADMHGVYIVKQGVIRRVVIEATIPFTSDRKRMTVVVRELPPPQSLSVALEPLFPSSMCPNYTPLAIMKGADSHVLPLCVGAAGACAPASDKRVGDMLGVFSRQGLRTLVFASACPSPEALRRLKAEEYRDIDDKRLVKAAAAVEKGLTFLGVTAVEDKLQEGVPDTLDALRQAGVRVWVLTGDKLETAVNIAYSSSLFPMDATLLRLEGEHVRAEMSRRGWSLKQATLAALNRLVKRQEKTRGQVCLVMDGNGLECVHLAKEDRRLIELCSLCSSCLFCRVTPKQKAQVTSQVQKVLKKSCLAVGDGANDVAMLLEADVGVGIAGNEGMQASRCSDVSISQFRHLRRLMFVHGRYNSVRSTTLIMYSIYKSILLVLPSLLFSFVNFFSTSMVVDDYVMFCYNIVLTLLPVFVYSLFEKDLPSREISNESGAYTAFIRKGALNDTRVFVWLMDTIVHGGVIYFCGIAFYGRSFDAMSVFFSTTVFLVALFRLWLCVQSFNLYFVLTNALSIVCYVVLLVVLEVFGLSPGAQGAIMQLGTDWRFYVCVFLTVTPCIAFSAVVNHIRTHFTPSTVNVIASRSQTRGCVSNDRWLA